MPPRRSSLALPLLPAALLLGCAASHPPPPALETRWQSPLHRDHPLVGRIWDVQAARYVPEGELVAAVERARFVLLGETHDNPDDHALQARLVRALISSGRRPALAFEMLDTDEQGTVDAVLRGPEPTAAALGGAVGWDRSGWPPFALYQPIFQAGLDAHLPIVAANLSRRGAREVIHHGARALPPVLQELLNRAGSLSAEEARARAEEMEALHCGQLPEDLLAPMVLSQRARDAQLAWAVRSGATAQGGAVLITGAEHARRDRGAASFLFVAGIPPAQVASVAFREVDPEALTPADYDLSPFDLVVFTPAAQRGDPCEEMRPPPTPPTTVANGG